VSAGAGDAAGSAARALWLTAPGTLALVPIPAPPPGLGEVQLRAVCSGISHGTELHLVRGTAPFQHRAFDPDLRRFVPRDGPGAPAVGPTDGLPGTPLGYELVGEVVAAGPGVDVAEGTLVHAPVPHAETVTVPLGPELALGYPAQVLPRASPPRRARS
jgi:threonine dehydrogenase-like Zn-dependent dehydrogenase